MAIVPRAERRVTQLRNIPASALQTDSAVPQQFGATEAQQISQIGGQLAQAGLAGVAQGQAIKQKADIRDALNDFGTFSREYNRSMFDLKAKDATEIFPKSQEAYQESMNKIANRFTNPAQKEVFLSNANRTTQNSLSKIFTHQENQISAYEDLTLDAENQSFLDNAIQNRFDSEYIRGQELGVVANTNFKNEKYGLGGEVGKRNIEAAINNFNVKVLDSYQSPSEASKYLDDNWDKFAPAVRTELREKIDKQLDEVFIREKSIEISTSGLPFDQQLAQVDQIKDPDQARQVRAQVKTRWNEKQTIEKVQQQKYVESEWDKIFQNPLGYIIPIKDLDSTTQRQMLSFKNQAIKEENARNGIGGKAQTDFVLYNDIMSLNDEDFLNEDLTKHIGRLSESRYVELVKIQRGIRKKDQEPQRLRTYQQQAKDKITGMNQFDAKRGEFERNNRNRFMEQFNAKLNTIPSQEQTEQRVGELLDFLLEPVSRRRPIHKLFDTLGKNKLFRFDIPYLDDKKQQNLILDQQVPENLAEIANLNFDKRTQQYFVDYDEFREVFDIYGNLIAKGRRINA